MPARQKRSKAISPAAGRAARASRRGSVDPVTGDELATVSAKGLDLKGALDLARRKGQGGLRSMSYAERAKLVGAVADVLHRQSRAL